MIPSKLPAKPISGGGSKRNRERALSAFKSVKLFAEQFGERGEPAETVLIDLMVNILHLLDYLPEKSFHSRLEIDDILRVAKDHYQCERVA